MDFWQGWKLGKIGKLKKRKKKKEKRKKKKGKKGEVIQRKRREASLDIYAFLGLRKMAEICAFQTATVWPDGEPTFHRTWRHTAHIIPVVAVEGKRRC